MPVHVSSENGIEVTIIEHVNSLRPGDAYMRQ